MKRKVLSMKKIISLSLCVVLLIGMFSCGESASNRTSDSMADSTSTEVSGDLVVQSETETQEVVNDDLGEHDFGGYEYKILAPSVDSMTWITPNLNSEEMTGEALNDAVYTRNRAIEERFNMKFVETYDNWEFGINEMREVVNSGDNAYDLMNMLERNALSCYVEGMSFSYEDIPYIDTSKPYWSSNLSDYMSIAGENIFEYGDFSIGAYDTTVILLFNKKMLEDFNLENPYALVKNGTWTLDKFSEMMKAVTADIDGNGVMDEKDRYGYIAMPKQVLPAMWISCGQLSISKNENDEPVFNLANDEGFYNVISKVFSITRDTGSWYVNDIQSDIDTVLEDMFASNGGLFHDSSFRKLARLRTMDTDFGILPYPKYDESQEQYYTRQYGGNIAIAPITSNEIDKTGIILEAMACESRKTVLPAYYEISLKTKNSRDEESGEMLDIILSNRVYDLGDSFWCNDIRDGFLRNMFASDDRDLVSNATKVEKSINKKIAKVIEEVKALKK